MPQPLANPPSPEAILAAIEAHGSFERAAKSLGVSGYYLRTRLNKDKALGAKAKAIRERFTYKGNVAEDVNAKPGNMQLDITEDQLTLVYSTDNPDLGDVEDLIRARGIDPDEWIITNVKLQQWEGMTAPYDDGDGKVRNRKMPLNLWRVQLARKPHIILAAPATYYPPVKRTRRKSNVERPELIVIEGDHQAPYHDRDLHEASLYALEDLYKRHNLAEHVFLGDTMDLPTISAHRDHPVDARAWVNLCIQSGTDILKDKAHAAPNVRRRKLKGNHDVRLETELLGRSERMYGIKPASLNGEEQLDALDLRRLLHLDALGIELVENRRGWQHAEVVLVDGIGGLVVRHGWLTSANSAEKSVKKRGRSMVVGHTHRPEHHFIWDPSAELERQAATAGTMSQVRGNGDENDGEGDYPTFAVCDSWLQGFITVTRWPDGRFAIEHARWTGTELRWRDRSWTA